MPPFVDSLPTNAFVLCTALLVLEMAGLAFAIPLLRTKRNVWLNEEDAVRFSGVVADVEHRDVARVVRVHRNQVENFVPFFALGLLWLLRGEPAAWTAGVFALFAVARSAHLAFYLTRRGRLRTASHTVSFLLLLVLAGGLVWQEFRSAKVFQRSEARERATVVTGREEPEGKVRGRTIARSEARTVHTPRRRALHRPDTWHPTSLRRHRQAASQRHPCPRTGRRDRIRSRGPFPPVAAPGLPFVRPPQPAARNATQSTARPLMGGIIPAEGRRRSRHWLGPHVPIPQNVETIEWLTNIQ